MPTIYLPTGMAYVPCDDIALKIADAMYPDDGTDDEGWGINHATCWIDSEREIKEAVLSGALPVKKSTTHAPQTFLQGNAWKTGLVTIADLRAYVAERGITLRVADAPKQADTQPQTAPVVEAPDSETPEQRRARWLDWYGKGVRGAVQRVYERERELNPKADRSYIGGQIRKAQAEQADKKRAGAMFGQLVKDGTSMG